MLKQLNVLFNDTYLYQKIKTVNSLAEAISLIKSASNTKSFQDLDDSLPQLLQKQVEPEELNESDLLLINISGAATGVTRTSGCVSMGGVQVQMTKCYMWC